jgi:acetylornithine deacetylase/succinyl-diaminopimelate desuccinylase-like protein
VRRFIVNTGERGIAWRRLSVKGTPAHGSLPFGSDNSLVTAGEVVRRISADRPRRDVAECTRRCRRGARHDRWQFGDQDSPR